MKIFNAFDQHFTTITAVLVGIVSLALILPVFALCWYNQPLVEDFPIARQILQHYLVRSFVEFRFQEESSRYFSNLLLFFLNPLAIGKSYMNWFLPFASLTGFTLALLFLLNRLLGPSKHVFLPYLLSWLGLAVYLNGLPDLASAFFYSTKSITFHLPLILLLLVIGLMLTMLRYRLRNPVLNILRFLVASTLIFCICGSNEYIAILVMFMLSMTLFVRFFLFFRLDGQLLLYLIAGSLGMVLLLLSPITFDKLQVTESYPYTWDVVWTAGKIGLRRWVVWSLNSGMLLLMFVSFQAGLKANFPGGLGRLHPIWLFLGLLILIWVASLPYYFGINLKAWEVENTKYFLFFIGTILIFFQAGFYYQKRLSLIGYPGWLLTFVLVSAAGFVFSALRYSNVGIAYKDWLSGTAKNFKSEISELDKKTNYQSQVLKLKVPDSFVPSPFPVGFEVKLAEELTIFYHRPITIQTIETK